MQRQEDIIEQRAIALHDEIARIVGLKRKGLRVEFALFNLCNVADPIDMLYDVAEEGLCQVVFRTYFDEKPFHWAGQVIENPFWIDVALEANSALVMTEEWDNVLLESVIVRDGGAVKYLELVFVEKNRDLE